MKTLDEFISESKYIHFPARSEYGRTRSKVLIGEQKVSFSVRPQYVRSVSTSAPKRFPRKALAMVAEALAYKDRTTGLRLVIDEIEVYHVSRKSKSSGPVIISVEGRVRNADGRLCGYVRRAFSFTLSGKPLYAHHHELSLQKKHGRQGFGRRYLNWAKRKYREMGFKHISVYAAGGSYNGVYTWARLGFEATDGLYWHKWDSSFKNFMAGLEREVRTGRMPASLLAEVHKITKPRVCRVSVKKVANLGKRSKYRSRRGNHIGKELMLRATGWDGKLVLEDAA